MNALTFLSFICLITVSICVQDTLRFVQIIFRHGDRTPTKTLPSDTRGESIWPNGLGQLTQLGIQQEYELGQYFRRVYDGFLNETYVKNEISILSTDKDRTLMSAYSALAGLYPPKGFQKWGAEKNIALGNLWQPIPVKSLPYTENPMLSADVPCKRYDQLYNYYLKSTEAINLTKQNQMLSTNVPCPVYDELYAKQLNSEEAQEFKKHEKALIDHVIKEAGWKENTLDNVFDTYDVLFIMRLKNKENAWSHKDPEILEQLQGMKHRSYDFKYKTEHMIRIKAGTFLKELLNKTNSWINNEMNPRKKMILYSSHDSIIGALLFGLGIWNDKLPPYGCAIIFELHEPSPGQYVMKVLFKNDTVNNAVDGTSHPVQIPECGKVDCSIEKFREVVTPLVLDDYQKECQKSRTSFTATLIAVLLVVAVIVVILVGLAIWCRRRKLKNFNYRSANFSGDDPDTLT